MSYADAMYWTPNCSRCINQVTKKCRECDPYRVNKIIIDNTADCNYIIGYMAGKIAGVNRCYRKLRSKNEQD